LALPRAADRGNSIGFARLVDGETLIDIISFIYFIDIRFMTESQNGGKNGQ